MRSNMGWAARLTLARMTLAGMAAVVSIAACQPADPPRAAPTSADPSVFAHDHERSTIGTEPIEPLLAQVEALVAPEAFVSVVANEQGDGYEVGVYGLTLDAMVELEQALEAGVPVTVVARPASRVALDDLRARVAEHYNDGTVTAVAASLVTGTLHVGVADEASVDTVHATAMEMIDEVHPNLGDIELTVQVVAPAGG